MRSSKSALALLLMAVFGLGGAGPCLCTADLAENPAHPHACCERVKAGDTGPPTTNPSLEPASLNCAGALGAPLTIVAPDGTNPLKAPVAVVGGAVNRVAPIALTALGAVAPPPPHPPLVRSSVLRI